MPFDATIRSMARGSDHEAALAEEASLRQAAEESGARNLLTELAPYTRARDGICFGQTPGPRNEWPNVTIPSRIAHALSGWTLGAPGSGKTTLLCWLAMHDLCNTGCRGMYLDNSGGPSGFAHLLTRHVIPGVVMRSHASEGASLLARLRVVAPWRNRKLPSMHLTGMLPGGNLNARVASLVDVLASTTTSAGAAEFGPRMMSIAARTLKLMVNRGVPFPLTADVMANEGFRAALIKGCGDAELEAYMRDRFAADFREAGAAILARFDRITSDDATRLACFGPESFDVADQLETSTVVCNYDGGSPMHRALWASFFQASAVAAILARRPTKASPRLLLRVDEAHVGIPSTQQARLLDDAIMRIRGRRASILLAHQHAGQLSEYPFLRESLRATGYVVAFRVPPATFSASGCPLPARLLPGMGELSESEVEEVWSRVVDNLPPRTFLLHVPGLSTASIPVRAPTFDVEAFSRGAPKEIVELATEGQGGHERRELQAREDAWRKVVAELRTTTGPNVDALQRLAEQGTRPRRSSRGRRPASEVG
jgi:hypothetical protein